MSVCCSVWQELLALKEPSCSGQQAAAVLTIDNMDVATRNLDVQSLQTLYRV